MSRPTRRTPGRAAVPTALRAAGAALAAAISAAACATTVPTVDTFSGSTLDSSRWAETESFRHIDAQGRLHLGHWSLGRQGNPVGTTGDSQTVLATASGPVRILKVTVQVEDADRIGACAANPQPSVARAWLSSAFFNARGAGPVPGDQTGDVQARIGVLRRSSDPASTVQVVGEVVQCTNRTCSAPARIGTAVLLGSAAAGQPVTLQINWDRVNSRFGFYKDADPGVAVPYRFARLGLPAVPFRLLGIRNDVAQCATGRVQAGLSVVFDDLEFTR